MSEEKESKQTESSESSQPTKVIWNPFKRGFWAKDNLMPPENRAKLKADMDEAKRSYHEEKERQLARKQDDNAIEKRIRRFGWRMTGAITLPILGTLILGPVGLVIGLFIGILIIFASRKKK